MVTRTKKIFVGGVSASSTEEDLTNYFKQYGEASVTETAKYPKNVMSSGPHSPKSYRNTSC